MIRALQAAGLTVDRIDHGFECYYKGSLFFRALIGDGGYLVRMRSNLFSENEAVLQTTEHSTAKPTTTLQKQNRDLQRAFENTFGADSVIANESRKVLTPTAVLVETALESRPDLLVSYGGTA